MLAVIPTALAAAGDKALVVTTVGPTLRRFRKPHRVRQSSALAIGSVGAKATPRLVDTLIATARRDPNDLARRFGIVALGELAAANPGDPESGDADPAHAEVGNKLVQYYKGAFAGRSVQKSDAPWLYLSAALFTRGHPGYAAWVSRQLRPIATRASAKHHQAAAIVALGLMNDRGALPMLSKLYEGARDKLVKGYLVETLGVLGDRTQRDSLLELVKTDGSGEVRYRAALGLGFSADRHVVKALAEELGTTSSNEAKVAIARVLGELGDRHVLATLARIAADAKADTWTRRRALSAIGMIAETDDHAWNTEIRRGANFPAAAPTIRFILRLF